MLEVAAAHVLDVLEPDHLDAVLTAGPGIPVRVQVVGGYLSTRLLRLECVVRTAGSP
ncbi:hypothetical protein [Desertihabitans brevis]|uniref:hypothetical protein n=1 Tax=Desertihabitans brevis TaxID=2268447 RepID=UPI0018F5C319|nr:hypothetical protein [Desertihabitans brevis]